MSFDYATQLLLQRGRDAGGIAVELVEMIEEMAVEMDDGKCADAQDYENTIEEMEKEAKTVKRAHEDEMNELFDSAHALADALHNALRHNDLATVNKCREALGKFREKFPKID